MHDSDRCEEAVGLPLDVAVDLAHAFTQHVASESGIRVVFIKGPVANHHGLRPSRVSSDVDVMVEPARMSDFLSRLEAHGWFRRPASTAHESFVTHSVSLSHQSWPVDIDVHHAYPGVFASDEDLFESLWRRRILLPIAAVSITSADFEASLIISVLHSLRSLYFGRQRQELEWAITAASAQYAGERGWYRLTDLARELSCEEPLAPFFERIGVPYDAPERPSVDFLRWKVKSQDSSRAASWLLLITEARGILRLRHLARALFPTKNDLNLDHPSAGRGVAARARVRLQRVINAAHALPAAVQVVWQARRPRRRVNSLHAAAVPDATAPFRNRESADRSEISSALISPAPRASSRIAVAVTSTGDPRSLQVGLKRAENLAFIENGGVFVLPLSDMPDPLAPVALLGNAYEIWRATEMPTTMDALLDEVSTRVSVSVPELREDVEHFLSSLQSMAILAPTRLSRDAPQSSTR